MNTNGESIYYITIGSILSGIIFSSLAMMGYFPSLHTMLLLSLICAFIMLGSIISLAVSCTKSSIVPKTIIIPYITGILGTISFSSLTLSTYIDITAKSTLLLLFISACFFTFMLSYFFKLMLCIFR